MLVQMIDVLDNPVLPRRRRIDVVKRCEMLHIFAKPDSTGMGTHRHAELCRHQDDGKVFIDTRDTAAIDLADINRVGLHELFEHDLTMAVLATGNTHAGFAPDAGVP